MSATLARRENISRLSINFMVCSEVQLSLNGEYRSAATGVQAAIQVVVGMRRHGGMVHLLYFGMMREKIHDFKRVLHVPLHAQRQGLQSLQKQKGVEWRYGRAGVAQWHAAHTGHERASGAMSAKTPPW